jgi:hypothetical protein
VARFLDRSSDVVTCACLTHHHPNKTPQGWIFRIFLCVCNPLRAAEQQPLAVEPTRRTVTCRQAGRRLVVQEPKERIRCHIHIGHSRAVHWYCSSAGPTSTPVWAPRPPKGILAAMQRHARMQVLKRGKEEEGKQREREKEACS